MIIDGDAFTFRFELPVGRWIWVPIVSWFSVCMDGVRYISKYFQFLPHPHLHNSWGQSVYLEPIRTYYLVIWPLVWLWFQHVWTFFLEGRWNIQNHPEGQVTIRHARPAMSWLRCCYACDEVTERTGLLMRIWSSNRGNHGKSWECHGISMEYHGIRTENTFKTCRCSPRNV